MPANGASGAARTNPTDLFELAPDAILEVDARGLIVRANRRAGEMFGYSPDALAGQAVELLLPDALRAAHRGMRQAFTDGTHRRDMGSGVEIVGQRRDGTLIQLDIALVMVAAGDGTAPRVLAFARDVSHLKRLQRAEQELLDQTLVRIVSMLGDVISLTSPRIFSRSYSVKSIAAHVAGNLRHLAPAEVWKFEIAAALCLVGCIAVPVEIFDKSWAGVELTEEEDRVMRDHPAIGRRLLRNIPRLAEVAEIIGRQQEDPAAPPTLPDAVATGAAILHLALQADRLLFQGVAPPYWVTTLRERHVPVSAPLLAALQGYILPHEAYKTQALTLAELRPAMVLDEDLMSVRGVFIARRQTIISPLLLERIRNFAETMGVREPLVVRVPISF